MARSRALAVVVLLATVSVACGDGGSPLAPTPTPVTPVPTDFVGRVLAEDTNQPLVGVTVTIISSVRTGESTQTDPAGQYLFPQFDGDEMHIRLEKDGYETVEVTVSRQTATTLLSPTPVEVIITVELPYPEDANFNRGVSGVIVSCPKGCDNHQRGGTTDHLGRVVLTGTPPLTIRTEKSGYVSVERQVTTDSTVAIGHEWPLEVREVIRRLELTDAITGGELLLVWADTRYFTGGSRGGLFKCYTTSQAVLVREWRGRDFMINTLIHELVHAWQGRNSGRPPCYTEGWYLSVTGRAWVAATELDMDPETGPGPIPDFDEKIYGGQRPLSEIPHENHAALLADWYMGARWGRNPGSMTKDDWYQLAPHRSHELEHGFGPPRSQ